MVRGSKFRDLRPHLGVMTLNPKPLNRAQGLEFRDCGSQGVGTSGRWA